MSTAEQQLREDALRVYEKVKDIRDGGEMMREIDLALGEQGERYTVFTEAIKRHREMMAMILEQQDGDDPQELVLKIARDLLSLVKQEAGLDPTEQIEPIYKSDLLPEKATSDAIIQGSVELCLQNFTLLELVELNLVINSGSTGMRRDCERFPWFERIRGLFTIDEGENMHQAVVDAISSLVQKELEKGEDTLL